jgi:hypothetical protein
MLTLLAGACILLFPALAIQAWRGDGVRLGAVAVGALAVIVVAAMVAASARFGNALSAQQGYGHTLLRILPVFGLTLGLPVLSATATIAVLGRRTSRRWLVYVAGIAAAMVAWVAGAIGLIWFMAAMAQSVA